VIALPTSACPVAEVSRVTKYLAAQSARQCGPCVHGLGSIAHAVGALAAGRPWPGSQLQLLRWLSEVAGRGTCHHPDGAARFIASALDVFASEFNDHARHGPCDRCHGRAWLPVTAEAKPV
jgi:NADH:ubiquinone oxidoreductase subunit F (NADH-binding)